MYQNETKKNFNLLNGINMSQKVICNFFLFHNFGLNIKLSLSK